MSVNKAGVVPAAEGVNTDWDKAQLEIGQYSVAENVRVSGPGFKMRPGLVRHHTTDFGTVLSMFSYKKGEKFYAQLNSGDVHEATNAPPATTTGAFKTMVLDASGLNNESTGTIYPGSWSTFRDNILFSQGNIQHTLKPAINGKPRKVIFKNNTVVARILEGGTDITDDVTDPGSTKTAELLTFTVANEDALYICTELPALDFYFDISNVPAGTKTMSFSFHSGDAFVPQTTGITDGTLAWAQDGTYATTMAGRATDGVERPTVMFGQSGYWYRFKLGSDDATPDVSFNSITYNGAFRLLENVMESMPDFIIEAQVETAAGEYETYAASTVTISELAAGDYIHFATYAPAWALYVNVGATPNTTASTAIAGLDVWTGIAYTAVTDKEDDTNGLANSGYISWDRSAPTPKKSAMNNNKNHMYWYRIKFDKAISTGVILSLQALFYWDINEFGRTGNVSTVWKDRGIYTFSRLDRDLYVSKKYRMNVLNGSDYATLTPGDGRYNRVTAMLPFYNELMVFQKEEGSMGGCITLFEGYSPETFGKLVLSTRLGSFSQQSVCIVDASTDTTRTTDVTQTQVAFISKYGIFFTDGRTIRRISGPIDDLFDPQNSNYINSNPGSGHWIEYDRASNCLRLGIQTIASTTGTPDSYPVFHLDGNYWTFDAYPLQSITAFCEVSAVSGYIDSIQYVAAKDTVSTVDLIYRATGGIDYDEEPDGTKQPIEMKLRPEFSNGGNYLEIKEFTIRTSAQEDHTMTKTIYENGVLDSSETETYTMEAADTNGTVFRKRILENMQLNSHFSVHISIKNLAIPASWGTGPVIYDFIHHINTIPNID